MASEDRIPEIPENPAPDSTLEWLIKHGFELTWRNYAELNWASRLSLMPNLLHIFPMSSGRIMNASNARRKLSSFLGGVAGHGTSNARFAMRDARLL